MKKLKNYLICSDKLYIMLKINKNYSIDNTL